MPHQGHRIELLDTTYFLCKSEKRRNILAIIGASYLAKIFATMTAFGWAYFLRLNFRARYTLKQQYPACTEVLFIIPSRIPLKLLKHYAFIP
jgi:hypothetical protein